MPSRDYQVNTAWCHAASIACDLLAWLRLLALHGDLAKAEPKALRQDPAHRRADRQGTAPAAPQNRGVLALGQRHRRRLHPDPGPAATTPPPSRPCNPHTRPHTT